MTGWSLGGATVNADGGSGRMREMVAETTGLDPVTIKAFPAFGMLLDHGAALQVAELDEPWAQGVRTWIRPGLFDDVTTGTAR